MIQATETLKIILGIGTPLVGKLVLFNALEMELTKVNVRKEKNCPICGEKATIKELIDCELFCGLKPSALHTSL